VNNAGSEKSKKGRMETTAAEGAEGKHSTGFCPNTESSTNLFQMSKYFS